jgi:hypothetical protein
VVVVAGGKGGYVGRDGHPGEGGASSGPPGAPPPRDATGSPDPS